MRLVILVASCIAFLSLVAARKGVGILDFSSSISVFFEGRDDAAKTQERNVLNKVEEMQSSTLAAAAPWSVAKAGVGAHTTSVPSDERKHTTQPIVTGTTVIGLKYAGGVMLAADTLASYGSMARYKDARRIQSVGENTLIGASGEVSDFQSVMETLENMNQEDLNADDGYRRSPSEVFNYLRAVMYQRRNKGNPLWNQLLIAGYKSDGKSKRRSSSIHFPLISLIHSRHSPIFLPPPPHPLPALSVLYISSLTFPIFILPFLPCVQRPFLATST